MTAQKAQALSHTYQSQTSANGSGTRIKPHTFVNDSQTNTRGCPYQLDMGQPGTAVLNNVAESLLNDAKKAKCYVWRNLFRHFPVDKLDPNVVLFSSFFAKAFR